MLSPKAVGPCRCVPRLLQHENEELRRRLTYVTNKMEAMERELESGQDYLEMELGQNREELEKFKDKFRRYGKEKEKKKKEGQSWRDRSHQGLPRLLRAGCALLCRSKACYILRKVLPQTEGRVKASQVLLPPGCSKHAASLRGCHSSWSHPTSSHPPQQKHEGSPSQPQLASSNLGSGGHYEAEVRHS